MMQDLNLRSTIDHMDMGELSHNHYSWQQSRYQVQWLWQWLCYAEGAKGGKGKRTTPGIPQTVVTIHSNIIHRAWKDKGSRKRSPKAQQPSKKNNTRRENKKNNTRDSNVVPHRSTNLARQCLTSLSRREAVLSLWCGRSCVLVVSKYL